MFILKIRETLATQRFTLVLNQTRVNRRNSSSYREVTGNDNKPVLAAPRTPPTLCFSSLLLFGFRQALHVAGCMHSVAELPGSPLGPIVINCALVVLTQRLMILIIQLNKYGGRRTINRMNYVRSI